MLPDGRVLVTGGLGPKEQGLRSCEVFDPVAMTWGSFAEMRSERYGHALAVVGERVMAAGGDRDARLTSEVCDDPTGR